MLRAQSEYTQVLESQIHDKHIVVVFRLASNTEFANSTDGRNASVSLPIDLLASPAAVVGIVAPRATFQATCSGLATSAPGSFSHQCDATFAFARHRRTQAPPKVHLMEADKEFLFALLDVQHLLDQVFQIPECRRRKHRKLAQDPMHPRDRYQHITLFAHDLARV